MIFNSFQFLWLFPLIFGGYYAISYLLKKKEQGKESNVLLLLISYALYMQYVPWCAFVLLWVTLVTYFMALCITVSNKSKKLICWLGTISGIAPLIIFKYYNFVIDNANGMLGHGNLPGLNWAIPIGISFFSFQAIGYLVDVYRQRIPAERNFLDYALFVSFFPQIMSGPISRASDLLPQIKGKRTFDETHKSARIEVAAVGYVSKDSNGR